MNKETLERLYLKRELLRRDLIQIQQKLAEIEREIRRTEEEIAGGKGRVKMTWDGYDLVEIEVEEVKGDGADAAEERG